MAQINQVSKRREKEILIRILVLRKDVGAKEIVSGAFGRVNMFLYREPV
jgi:hypothetical protein